MRKLLFLIIVVNYLWASACGFWGGGDSIKNPITLKIKTKDIVASLILNKKNNKGFYCGIINYQVLSNNNIYLYIVNRKKLSRVMIDSIASVCPIWSCNNNLSGRSYFNKVYVVLENPIDDMELISKRKKATYHLSNTDKEVFHQGNMLNLQAQQNSYLGNGEREERKLDSFEKYKIYDLSPIYAKENGISKHKAKELLSDAGYALVDKKFKDNLGQMSLIGCENTLCQEQKKIFSSNGIYDEKDFKNTQSFLLIKTMGQTFKNLEYEKINRYFIPTDADYYNPDLDLKAESMQKSSLIPAWTLNPAKLMLLEPIKFILLNQ